MPKKKKTDPADENASVEKPQETHPDANAESVQYILPEEVTHEYLVDLIDQPAWKTILLDIVKAERMDPWNIDVIRLADAYLSKINALEKSNLRVPANAILASAILLRHKAKGLRLTSLDEVEAELKERELSPEERALLASQIPELRGTRMLREGHVTLDALVASIETMLQKSSSSSRLGRKLEELRFVMPDASFNIEERMADVLKRVESRADSQGLVMFSQLVVEHKGDPIEVVNTFIPLLFLANRKKISIWQEQFWEDIFVKWNKEPASA
jgi:segregation and condensation protein A